MPILGYTLLRFFCRLPAWAFLFRSDAASCFFLVFGSLLASGEQGLSQLAFNLALTQQVLSSDSRPLNS